ncbi:MAG: nuclear transport factor 2 family protein [Alphaproteobacteria bacterium]|nr:nuclear transport factor 2 family protein [Alphaproteobacteria bacterium]
MNRFDLEGFMKPFAADALVNDRHRQFWGTEAIRKWADLEITGDHVSMNPYHVVNHYGDIIITAEIDGDYDKSDLPTACSLAFYFVVRDGKITQLLLLPPNGRNLSKITPIVEASSPYATSVPEPSERMSA